MINYKIILDNRNECKKRIIESKFSVWFGGKAIFVA